jgi:hypothetical protein
MTAPAVETLSEEERYLAAILMDRSGLDQAEFLWEAFENEDNCFRARPYQWSWWRSEDPLQVDLSARSVGKSLSISVRGFAHIFCNPGQEMLITAPELIHLEPVCQLVEGRILSTRLSREIVTGRGLGFTHRPFACVTSMGARILGRIPQRDGRGSKGVHPIWLELDESQDYPDKGFVELIETLKRGVSGAVWRAHGVTNGVGGFFYKITESGGETPPLRPTPKHDDQDWTIHRLVAMLREDWTDEEREEKIRQYGSKESPDYLRNVLGKHGPAQNVIFILRRLMKCADDDEESMYNQDEYQHYTIRDTDLERPGSDVLDFLPFPSSLKTYRTVWVGMDVGYVRDPSEILVFAEEHVPAADLRTLKTLEKAIPKDGTTRLKLVARISLLRVPEPVQADVILQVIDFFQPKAFTMDKTGNGLPLYQAVQARLEQLADATGSAKARAAINIIKGYNFSEKIVVDFDPAVDVTGYDIEDQVKEAGIKRMVLEVSTDVLRSLVDHERLWLPWDRDLLKQFGGQTYSYSQVTTDAYGRRRIFSQGEYHALDAARLAALAWKQHSIDAFLATREPETPPVYDAFVTF